MGMGFWGRLCVRTKPARTYWRDNLPSAGIYLPGRGFLLSVAESGALDRLATVVEVARVVELFAGAMGVFVSGQVLRVDGCG